MPDLGIKLLPDNGTKVNVGFNIGKDNIANQRVQDKFADHGLDVGNTIGTGLQVTVSRDLLTVGKKETGMFAISPEVSAGFLTHSGSVKVGEKPYWNVDVVETTRSWDKEQDDWVYTENRYTREFNNQQDAENYARLRNGDDSYDRETVAGYPEKYTKDINHNEKSTRASIKVGGALEFRKEFESFDGDYSFGVVGGVDLAKQCAPYVGGRVGANWDLDGGKTIGGFVQIDGSLKGATKGNIVTSVGVAVRF